MAAMLQFPSQEVLVNLLNNHLSLADIKPYLMEKKVTQAVAEAFANQSKKAGNIDREVMNILEGKKLGMPRIGLLLARKNLVNVLKESAEERPAAKL